MMQITIHSMQPKHYERVGTIYKQGIDSHHCTFESDVPTWEGFDANHLPFCRFVVLNEREEVIGWTALSQTSSRSCFEGVAEVSIYLDQHVIGQGIGEQLLNYLITESEQNGIWSLISGIFPENVASLRLHQKCGFRYVGYREKMGKTREGVFRDVLFMERRSLKVGV
ncbi:GNAT family N-acetyltransferase [Turicibacter sanguinis]|uniref:GNAT family N-acetyltransferase n=2 Tax=Turicibacter sanguinis TaxID=154288 RepID=UPI0012BBCA50|nr:GNAT family N-acetyltransferase [Turicibacter sanguinis]MCU7196112.1 GNAT family N-acetyltransferase [Turicibacter sanguinis]MCU7200634.1 GNAT family N-acetyltransferase [Turicibacter sanguinis]MDB8575049.1 GNAT family N-acetyltransferase [Turicibacter sanguinis]MDB8578068.1 GNAT family N-acetyltransferase [Turicibacter sanguinis]MDB8583544.1 GNAT family N-acetyltransferase [Turicibacter sanguinis]